MTLVRWNPWGELESVQSEMNRMFGNLFTRSALESPETPGAWYPSVDVSEDEQAIHLQAELPGMNRDEIELEMKEGILTIRGEKHFEKEEGGKERKYHRIERSYGTFVRQMSLPANVKEDQVKAHFKDGVLNITIPKAEESKPKRIQIES